MISKRRYLLLAMEAATDTITEQEGRLMEVRKKLLLLQITDSAFPIGAYSHSFGLETYIQKGMVKSREEAWNYIRQSIRYSLTFTELLGMRLACQAACRGDLEEVFKTEQYLLAARTPREVREGSQKLAARFIKTAGQLLNEDEKLLFSRYGGEGNRHMVNTAYGVFCAAAGIEIREALTCYLYSQVSAMAVNCVKAVPLSQTDGQQLLARSHALQEEAVARAMEADAKLLGLSMPGFDIRCMQHETLYSRLYMS